MSESLETIDFRRQETLLTVEDCQELLQDSQTVLGMRTSIKALYIRHSDKIVGQDGVVHPFTELDSGFVYLPDGSALVDLPKYFSSVQSEIEVTGHEIAHSFSRYIRVAMEHDPHAAYCVAETLFDMVGRYSRERIMESNTYPGVSSELLSESFSLSDTEINGFFESKISALSPDSSLVGHKLGRRLLHSINPLIALHGIPMIAQAVIRFPPDRELLMNSNRYVTRLKEYVSEPRQVDPVKIPIVFSLK